MIENKHGITLISKHQERNGCKQCLCLKIYADCHFHKSKFSVRLYSSANHKSINIYCFSLESCGFLNLNKALR